MESTERLVRTWMASSRDEEIKKLASDITGRNTTLLNIVKALGEYLTSEEDKTRSKGVELLSLVLDQCPPEIINRKSAHVLAAFYCDKLDDTETIIPAIQGLVSLTKMPSCMPEDVPVIVRAIFTHVKMKVLVQSVRLMVFTIIDTIMARHREILKDMGQEFTSGYVTLADGEKDPRNLLVAFAIARVILIEFDISNIVESLFNITFCYFPISFRPPPNDPYGITTDDLRAALRSCLNATPKFGPMAIPVFLEKLTAGNPATKRDTLQTMSVCFPVYGSDVARSNARKLWNSLKLEIFQPTDPQTEQEALSTLQALVKVIYGEQSSPDSSMAGLAQDACEECIKILREPEKSQAKPAIKVLAAFMATTPPVSRYTLAQVIPHLVKLFISIEDTLSRPSILLLLSDLIAAARDSATRETEADTDSEHSDTPLTAYKDEVIGIVTSGLKAGSSRRPAIACLLGLVSTRHLLSDEELGFIVHNVNEIVQADPDESDDASDAALKLLSTISQVAPRHLIEQTLPLLFSALPDQAPPRDAAADRARCWRTLSALRTLCIQPELFEILVIRLTTRLDILCVPSTSTNDSDLEPTAAYAHSILTTIVQTLTSKAEEGHADVSKYIERLVPRLYNLFLFSALIDDGRQMVAWDPRIIRVAGQIITLVVQNVPAQRQDKFAASLFPAFIEGQVKGIAEGQQKLPTEAQFIPLKNSAPLHQRNTIPLFASAVVAFHKETPIYVHDLEAFLQGMLSWGLLLADNDLQRDAAWHVVSSVLNKHVEDTKVFPDNMLSQHWAQEIANVDLPQDRRQHAIRAWTWVSKALLLRNHPLASQYVDRLFEILGDSAVGWNAAKAIGQAVSPDDILTKRNHAVIKILYAQKHVNNVLPRIIAGANDASKPREQPAYLVALASLIKSTPKATYSHQIPSLIPLLLRGLDLPDNTIRADVIDTFLAAAEDDSPQQGMVAGHASSLARTMLRNSLVENMPSIRVRQSALKYLSVLPSIVRYDVLHPEKAMVIRELAKALDDPKRSVRAVAVEARTNWFKYNG